MKEALRKLADFSYIKILGPSSKIDLRWIIRVMNEMDVEDKNIEKLYALNAPLSREVWYYVFVRFYEEGKLHSLLNYLNETLELGGFSPFEKELMNLGVIYQNGKFKKRVLKLVVLVSGRGTNLQAIIDAIKEKKIDGKIVAVISNRKMAYALERAKREGIPIYYLPARKNESREDYDRRLNKIIEPLNPDLIVLAGFLRILSPWFVRRYRNKIINIHPSLLPSFAGLYGERVHKAVIEYGCKVSGCTVHFVDENVDHGPIIVQKCVEVMDDDTPETLSFRVLEKEHEALVEAIKLISTGSIKIEGRKVIKI